MMLTCAKIFIYLGVIIATCYMAMIGIFDKHPPAALFLTGAFFVGIGVVLGNIVAFKETRERRADMKDR